MAETEAGCMRRKRRAELLSENCERRAQVTRIFIQVVWRNLNFLTQRCVVPAAASYFCLGTYWHVSAPVAATIDVTAPTALRRVETGIRYSEQKRGRTPTTQQEKQKGAREQKLCRWPFKYY